MACDSSSTDPECGPGNGPHCYDHDPACCHCGKPRPECEGGCRIYTEPPCTPEGTCICGGEWWKHGCKHSLPPEPEKPALMCACGHSRNWHPKTNGHACTGDNCLMDCAEFRCDHTRCGWKPRCTCGPDEACSECPETPAEPPLTPEEEEEASKDEYPACSNCGNWHAPDDECVWSDPAPPQPDRRPPYLLAYSVQGHLYEIALPGDAIVAALDGRLVITHSLGPVAGICQIAPITNEESA